MFFARHAQKGFSCTSGCFVQSLLYLPQPQIRVRSCVTGILCSYNLLVFAFLK